MYKYDLSIFFGARFFWLLNLRHTETFESILMKQASLHNVVLDFYHLTSRLIVPATI